MSKNNCHKIGIVVGSVACDWELKRQRFEGFVKRLTKILRVWLLILFNEKINNKQSENQICHRGWFASLPKLNYDSRSSQGRFGGSPWCCSFDP